MITIDWANNPNNQVAPFGDLVGVEEDPVVAAMAGVEVQIVTFYATLAKLNPNWEPSCAAFTAVMDAAEQALGDSGGPDPERGEQ